MHFFDNDLKIIWSTKLLDIFAGLFSKFFIISLDISSSIDEFEYKVTIASFCNTF